MALDARGMVRLLIALPNTEELFTDDQVDAFLDLEGGSVKLASARACLALAVNEALVSKVIRDGQLSTDGASVAAQLRAIAKELRDSAAAEAVDSDDGYFEIVPVSPSHGYYC